MADKRAIVLTVDDNPVNNELLECTLGDDYRVKSAADGYAAIKMAHAEPAPDLIILDVMMPGLSGFETCSLLKEDNRTRNIPVIFVTALREPKDEWKGLELGAVDYIYKPFQPNLVKSRVRNQLNNKKRADELACLVAAHSDELKQYKDATIQAMGALASLRDPETGAHLKRTQNYVRLLAECLSSDLKYAGQLDAFTIDLLFKSAPLHDIGKVGIPDSILLKPGRLTAEEFEEMKKHTIIGYEAIQKAESAMENSSHLRIASEIAVSHHEWWDGDGYPFGLKGDEIPLSGRLMALADVYDALISKRVYKPAYKHEVAVKLIQAARGTHFDPDIVDAFVALQEDFYHVARAYSDQDGQEEIPSAALDTA